MRCGSNIEGHSSTAEGARVTPELPAKSSKCTRYCRVGAASSARPKSRCKARHGSAALLMGPVCSAAAGP